MAKRYALGGMLIAPDQWLRPGDAALLLDVGIPAVRQWGHSGKIPADAVMRTPGGGFRYRADAIFALREELQR